VIIVAYETITSPAQLADFCTRLARAGRIGLDTEFVSEDTYRPELCLVQVATEHELAVIDPYRTGDLSPFWETLAAGIHTTIAHAAREEVNFSLTACGRPPAGVFDTQIAAGLCSTEYPSSYGAVVTKLLGQKAAKGEQRTDWRRRPLSDAQIDYALEDVRYLLPMHDALIVQLEAHGRTGWLTDEMSAFLREVCEARDRPRWRRVSGIGNLSPRSLAVVRSLWQWREEQAELRDLPPRRVLRDDLIVELAKRKSDSPEKIRAIRGIGQHLKREHIQQIVHSIREGLEAPLDDIERNMSPAMPSQLNLLGQFLAPALASICRNANVATSLVGTATDVRDLIAYRLGFGYDEKDGPPLLASGWRAELVGHLIEELLAGKKSIRIADPMSEHPLAFDKI
jgi:ribonuclease D